MQFDTTGNKIAVFFSAQCETYSFSITYYYEEKLQRRRERLINITSLIVLPRVFARFSHRQRLRDALNL